MTNTLMLDVVLEVAAEDGHLPATSSRATSTTSTRPKRPRTASSQFVSAVVTAGLRGLLTREDVGHPGARLHERRSTSEGVLDERVSGEHLPRSARSRCVSTQLSRVGGRATGTTSSTPSSRNFAYNETVYASYVQQIAGRLALDLSGRYAHLNYQGQFVDPMQMTGRTSTTSSRSGATARLLPAQLGLPRASATRCCIAATPAANISPINDYLKQQVFVRARASRTNLRRCLRSAVGLWLSLRRWPRCPVARGRATRRQARRRRRSDEVSTPEDRVGIDDTFDVRVYGEAELSGTFRVATDGTVDYPLAGRLQVAGLRTGEIQQLLGQQAEGPVPQGSAGHRHRSRTATARRSRSSARSRKPGQVGYYPNMTIVDAIASAGGFTGIAAKNSVNLRREVARQDRDARLSRRRHQRRALSKRDGPAR